MKLPVYDNKGKKQADMDVQDAIFGVKPKKGVIHRVYVALESNAREPWAHSKDKSEVRGGGRKPWKQKGTGRARHGSIRSPIWKGGGVTFGPLNIRNYTKKINRKMNQSAVRMCLSDKAIHEQVMVLDGFTPDGKTKTFSILRQALPGAGRSTLILETNNTEKLGLAVRNISNVHMQQAADVNVVDLLHHQYVVATKEAIMVLEKRLAI